MLVLKRRREQSILIGPDVTVQVVKIEADAVYLAIAAPRELRISRAGRLEDDSALCSACSQRTDPTAN